MTVAELIERLRAFPPDEKIHAALDHWPLCEIEKVEYVTFKDAHGQQHHGLTIQQG